MGATSERTGARRRPVEAAQSGGKVADHVVAAAEAVVDRLGWDQLTMRALADELGVRPPSLYSHVRSLDALRAELQIRTLRLLGQQLQQAAMGRAGADGFRALAATHRAFAARYPSRYEGATRAPHDRERFVAAGLDANQAVLAMVRSCGLEGEAALYVELAAFAAVHGFVSLELGGFFGTDVDIDRIFTTVVDGSLGAIDAHTAAAATTPGGSHAC